MGLVKYYFVTYAIYTSTLICSVSTNNGFRLSSIVQNTSTALSGRNDGICTFIFFQTPSTWQALVVFLEHIYRTKWNAVCKQFNFCTRVLISRELRIKQDLVVYILCAYQFINKVKKSVRLAISSFMISLQVSMLALKSIGCTLVKVAGYVCPS